MRTHVKHDNKSTIEIELNDIFGNIRPMRILVFRKTS